MRIQVYRREDQDYDVLLLPSMGKALSPVLLQGVSMGNFTGTVLPEVTKMREYTRPEQLPLPTQPD